MKSTFRIILLLVLAGTGLLVNSCKKDTQSSVEALLARGSWQLASVQVFNYVGGSNTSTDTLTTDCSYGQIFTFNNTDSSCTYNDYACIKQNAKGTWHLSDDKLTLKSTLSVQDTSGTKTITNLPFQTARIVNLGQYSLILETGDLSSYFLPTDKRHVKRYGFIRN